ncbi:unnamed protein product, partial [Symbiodinium necroappetens]
EPTYVTVPIYETISGTLTEVETTVPVLDVYELLEYLYKDLGLVCPPEKAREYWQHMRQNGNPHALRFPAAGDSHIQFSLYGDECCLGDPKDKVTGIFVSLTLFKPKVSKHREFLIFAMQALPPAKQKLAGQSFAGHCKYACVELKGDWKWHE